MTEKAQNADFRGKPLIFADSPLLLEIPAFGGRRKPQKTADFRRKPVIFAENRRKLQIGHIRSIRHLWLGPISGSPGASRRHASQDTQPPLTPRQGLGRRRSARRQPVAQAQILVVQGLLCGKSPAPASFPFMKQAQALSQRWPKRESKVKGAESFPLALPLGGGWSSSCHHQGGSSEKGSCKVRLSSSKAQCARSSSQAGQAQ